MQPGQTASYPARAGFHFPLTLRTLWRVLGVLLALAGWWLSINLLVLSGGGQPRDPWLAAQCGASGNSGAGSDCLAVLRSERAFVVPPSAAGAQRPARGTPWAAFGAGYFAFVGLWYLFVGPPTRSRWGWHAVIALVVVVGLWCSSYLMQVMAYELKRWCAGCLAVHGLNAALGIVTFAAFPWRGAASAAAPHPATPLALATLLLGLLAIQTHVLAAGAAILSRGQAALEAAYSRIVEDAEFVLWKYAQATSVTIPLPENEIWLGPIDAPNTAVAFVDFQCPRCRQACELLSEFARRPAPVLRVAFKHFPLDLGCNPAVKTVAHPAACRAALALEAVTLLGGAAARHAMRERMYAHQSDLERDPYAAWAAELGLDRIAYDRALASAEAAERIARDVQIARDLGVESVPTIFLNGRRLEFWPNRQAWERLLAASLHPADAPDISGSQTPLSPHP